MATSRYYIGRWSTISIVEGRNVNWKQLTATPYASPEWRATAARMIRSARRYTRYRGVWSPAMVDTYWQTLRFANRSVFH